MSDFTKRDQVALAVLPAIIRQDGSSNAYRVSRAFDVADEFLRQSAEFEAAEEARKAEEEAKRQAEMDAAGWLLWSEPFDGDTYINLQNGLFETPGDSFIFSERSDDFHIWYECEFPFERDQSEGAIRLTERPTTKEAIELLKKEGRL